MKIAIIGECMVELSQQHNREYQIGFGGDTLNTAIYLSRCGGSSDYFTVLGDDSFSKDMIKQWQSEGVGVEQVKIQANTLPGLYLIENDAQGERYFHYWRQNSPARKLINDFPDIFIALHKYPYIFISGITLSLYSDNDLNTLFSFIQEYRENGGVVIFDNNYRLRNWPNQAYAVSTFERMMKNTDIALISYDDELAMYGEHSIQNCIDRWCDHGATEVVIKNGQHGCHLITKGKTSHIPLHNILKPIDTTAAGDSFNGAYLAEKLAGKSPEECIDAGQRCAGNVIMHKGAIIDKSINLMEAYS